MFGFVSALYLKYTFTNLRPTSTKLKDDKGNDMSLFFLSSPATQ